MMRKESKFVNEKTIYYLTLLRPASGKVPSGPSKKRKAKGKAKAKAANGMDID
jgi:hypothetical protein